MGKLGTVWRERQKAERPAKAERPGDALPYFLEVPPALLNKTKMVRAARTLEIASDPDIQQLHAAHPEVSSYRSQISHFGLAFIKDDSTYVKGEGKYQQLGAVSFEALSYLGSLIAERRPIRISVGKSPCLRKTFDGRVRKNDRPLGQAFVIGQGLPVVDIQAAELDHVWKCMERDHASMTLSRYYDYLVVTWYPPSNAEHLPPP